MPNVGKSSLINSLKRARACQVGAVPGVTRYLNTLYLIEIQLIMIYKHFKLYDNIIILFNELWTMVKLVFIIKL